MESPKKNTNTLDSFEKLKQILLTEDQQKIANVEKELENLREQLKDKEHFIETLSPVLASMLENKIIESKGEMAEALAPIMGEAIRKQIEDSKEDVIDALYPVIGSTIRKSIAEAMKNLVNTVNEKIDKTFSFLTIKSKIRSKVTGVSTAEIFLKESIPFQIHEVFYIHRETGILLSHASVTLEDINVDKDLISGMLTAIRNFASTILGKDEDQNVHKIQYDNFQIQLEVGRYAYLAVVISGVKKENFNEKFKHLEQKLHQCYFKQMRDFEGDISKFEGISTFINKFLSANSVQEDSGESLEKSSKSIGWALGILFLLFSILYFTLFYFPKMQIEENITSEINILSKTVPELANGKIGFKVDGSNVELFGEVDSWITKRNVESIIIDQSETKTIKNNILVNNEEASAIFRQRLDERNVDINASLLKTLQKLKYIFINDQLYIEGKVNSLNEKVMVGNAVASIVNFPIIINNVTIEKEKFNEAQYLIHRIEEIAIHFLSGKDDPKNEELVKVKTLSNWLKEIPFAKLYICGHADELGDEKNNLDISRQRSEKIKNLLVEYGIESTKLIVEYVGTLHPLATNKTEEGRSLNRRVTFSFHPSN